MSKPQKNILTSLPSDRLDGIPSDWALDDQVAAGHRGDLGHLPDEGQSVDVDPGGVQRAARGIGRHTRVLAAILFCHAADVEV